MIPATPPAALHLGFLTVLAEAGGFVGGYLVTNAWGRPLEFRYSSAVQPNRMHQILYGDTLPSYLHADLIGRTLIEKTATPAHLILTDREAALELRPRFELPIVWVTPPDDAVAARLADSDRAVRPARAHRHGPVLTHADFASEAAALRALLDRAADVDLAEPFQRVREAVQEARQAGGTHRVA
jgi:hypothetical protein